MRVRKHGKSFSQIHWGVEAASREFGCDGETLTKAFKRASIEPAFKDATFSTLQVVSALFGDYDAQRTRKVTHEANLLELEEKKERGELVPMDALIEKLQRGLQAMTAGVMAMTELTIEQRENIIKQIRSCGDSVAASDGDSPASA